MIKIAKRALFALGVAAGGALTALVASTTPAHAVSDFDAGRICADRLMQDRHIASADVHIKSVEAALANTSVSGEVREDSGAWVSFKCMVGNGGAVDGSVIKIDLDDDLAGGPIAESDSSAYDRGYRDGLRKSYDRAIAGVSVYSTDDARRVPQREARNRYAPISGPEMDLRDDRSGGDAVGLPNLAESACRQSFGAEAMIGEVTAPAPGFWDVTLSGNDGRRASCVVSANGEVRRWNEH